MSLNQTPQSERVHIGIYGRRNAGKSSLLNALTGQALAVVSEVAGTTTDPVRKSMEILPIGPVVMIDTPGLDDVGEIGLARVTQAKKCLMETDIAMLVVDATKGLKEPEKDTIALFLEKKIPFITVYNKCDLIDEAGKETLATTYTQYCKEQLQQEEVIPYVFVSAGKKEGVSALLTALEALWRASRNPDEKPLVKDLVKEGDHVILVIPIDEAAPKGRIILPQQQVLRELLEIGAVTSVVTPGQLEHALEMATLPPRLVITDSQAFGYVNQIVPKEINLTSFSILMARRKGNFEDALAGVSALGNISDDSSILICEGCSHKRQCGDIGTVKLPGWIRKYTKANPQMTWTQGKEFPDDLSGYDLIVHCGGCMLNEKEMSARYEKAKEAGVPMTNYGMVIAKTHGILDRTTFIF